MKFKSSLLLLAMLSAFASSPSSFAAGESATTDVAELLLAVHEGRNEDAVRLLASSGTGELLAGVDLHDLGEAAVGVAAVAVDVVVGLGLAQCAEERIAQFRGQRIPRLRTVQGQGAHPVGGVDQQTVGHIGSLLGWSPTDTVSRGRFAPIVEAMCRNITELRGLEPAATAEEIEAAARQYIRKVSGITRPTAANVEAFEAAVAEVTAVTERLLDQLPARRQPPKTVPPLRRPEVQARLAAK